MNRETRIRDLEEKCEKYSRGLSVLGLCILLLFGIVAEMAFTLPQRICHTETYTELIKLSNPYAYPGERWDFSASRFVVNASDISCETGVNIEGYESEHGTAYDISYTGTGTESKTCIVTRKTKVCEVK